MVMSAKRQDAAKRQGSDFGLEPEITPEMIEAGAAVIFAGREDLMAWTLAERVYRAMERGKRDRRMTERER